MSYMDKNLRQIHRAIINGEVTPLQLVKEAIELAKNDKYNSFEYICEKEALEKVKTLDKAKIGHLLYGIPVVLKDNISTKDIPTTASSEILKDYVPVYSAEVVSRLENEGAIIIGKATMDELAMGGTGTTGHLGVTYNPWDKSRTHIIGGSSCGSASAVSAGMVPISIGSDTGDSVRRPASYAGLVGVKPTWGRISRFGLFPFAPSFDHVGYLARNVYDAAYLLNVLAGRDDKDTTSSFQKVDDYTKDLDKDIGGCKIAVIKNIIDEIQDRDVLDAFNNTIEKLRAKGALIDYIEMNDKLLKAIQPTYYIISSSESMSCNANLDGIKFGSRVEGKSYEEIMINTRSKNFSLHIKSRFIIGSYSMLEENREELFLRAQKARRMIVDVFNKVFEKYDAIYCPATPSISPLINIKKDMVFENSGIANHYMAFANMGGFPSLSLPIGFSKNMPFGGNLTAKPFQESKLFNIANAIEKETGLFDLVAR